MTQKYKINKISQKKLDEELALFYQSMQLNGAIPLSKKKIRIPLLSPPILNQKIKITAKSALPFYEKLSLDEVGSEDFIGYKQPSLPNEIFQKLKNNQFVIDAILDLHGLIVEEALLAVSSFIQQCLEKEIRIALIIHGKGHGNNMPILKNKINHWLREEKIILAFCSAKPMHGGCGAVYVLLEKN